MLQNFGQTHALPQKFGVFKKFQEFLNFYGVLWQILLEFGKYSIFQSYLEFYFKYSWWNFFLEYCISKLRNSDQVTGPSTSIVWNTQLEHSRRISPIAWFTYTTLHAELHALACMAACMNYACIFVCILKCIFACIFACMQFCV